MPKIICMCMVVSFIFFPLNNSIAGIIEYCEDQWPGNYEMIEYCQDNQMEAHGKFRSYGEMYGLLDRKVVC